MRLLRILCRTGRGRAGLFESAVFAFSVLTISGRFSSQQFMRVSRIIISVYIMWDCEVREYWVMESSMNLYSFIHPENFETIRLSLLFR